MLIYRARVETRNRTTWRGAVRVLAYALEATLLGAFYVVLLAGLITLTALL